MALTPKYTQEEMEQRHKAKLKRESRRRKKKALLLLILLLVLSIGIFVGKDFLRPSLYKIQETLVDMGFETNFISYSQEELKEMMKSELERDVLHYNAIAIIDGKPETQTGFIFGNYAKDGEVQKNKAHALETIKYQKMLIAMKYADKLMEQNPDLTRQKALDKVNQLTVNKEYMEFLREKVTNSATQQDRLVELEKINLKLATEDDLLAMLDSLLEPPTSSKYFVQYSVYLKEGDKAINESLKLYETQLIRVGEKSYSEELLVDLPNGTYETYVVQTKYDMVTKEKAGTQQVVAELRVAK